jgi:hypothetical protein
MGGRGYNAPEAMCEYRYTCEFNRVTSRHLIENHGNSIGDINTSNSGANFMQKSSPHYTLLNGRMIDFSTKRMKKSNRLVVICNFPIGDQDLDKFKTGLDYLSPSPASS